MKYINFFLNGLISFGATAIGAAINHLSVETGMLMLLIFWVLMNQLDDYVLKQSNSKGRKKK